MAEKPSIPIGPMTVDGEDNLKLIRGIGPAIEQKLHDAGIHTYARLAEMSSESLAALLADMTGFSVQRIEQRDWIGQARLLAEELKQQNLISELPEHEHYALFSLELLLNEHNQVRRTRVTNVQTQNEDAWAGWNLEHLVAFLSESSGMAIEIPNTPLVAARSAPETALTSENLAGELQVSEINIRAEEPTGAQRLMRSHQPFMVMLKLDLSQAAVHTDRPLDYQAIIYARRVAGGWHREIGRSEGQMNAADHLDVGVPVMALPDGAYRLEAVVTLKLGANGEPGRQKANLMAMMEGTLLQVY